jgi:hypothetical protein
LTLELLKSEFSRPVAFGMVEDEGLVFVLVVSGQRLFIDYALLLSAVFIEDGSAGIVVPVPDVDGGAEY